MIDIKVLPVGSSMLLTLGALLVLYFGLKKLLYKPVSEALSNRQEKIKSDIESAKAQREEAEALKSNYEAQIADAKREAQSIIENGRKRGEEVRADIIGKAEEDARSIVMKARREAEAEKERALMDIKSEAGDMAVLIASKILEENVEGNQQHIIDNFINEVGNQKWQN